MPNNLLTSRWRSLRLNNVGGSSDFSVYCTFSTVPVLVTRSAHLFAVASSTKRLSSFTIARPWYFSPLSVSNVAETCQNGSTRKSLISLSRWTIKARVGVWTRPTEKSSPCLTVNALVELIPTIQSACARTSAAA